MLLRNKINKRVLDGKINDCLELDKDELDFLNDMKNNEEKEEYKLMKKEARKNKTDVNGCPREFLPKKSTTNRKNKCFQA